MPVYFRGDLKYSLSISVIKNATLQYTNEKGKRSEGSTINKESLFPGQLYSSSYHKTFYTTILNFAYSKTWLKITLHNGKFIS